MSKDKNNLITRYVTFEKLYDMLAHKRLPLIRLDRLEDWREGLIPEATLSELADTFQNASGGSQIDTDAIRDAPRTSTYVSSWVYGWNESNAMWKIYCQPNGVAVVCDFGELKKAMSIYSLEFHEINYLNLNELSNIKASNAMATALRKNIIFEYENETRIILTREQLNKLRTDKGIDKFNLPSVFYVSLNWEHIIRKIIASPYTQQWVYESYEKIIGESLKNLKLLRRSAHSLAKDTNTSITLVSSIEK